MSIFFSHKKIFLLGFILVILIAIPFSVYITQKRQRTISKASQSTTLSFDPSSKVVLVGQILTLDVVLDPGTGTTANQVSFVKLSISFDPAKFATVSDSLAPNPNSPNTLTSVLEDPVYPSGKASISLSIGDPARVVVAKTKIAILKLKVLSTTDANNPSSITFDSAPNTQVLSIASSDQTSENVLSTSIPATITINPALAVQPSPSTTPTATPTPSPTTAPLPSAVPTTVTTGLDEGTKAAEFEPIIVPQAPQILPIAETFPPTGPEENILGIGIIGAILTIIGGAIFMLF